jgi:hypothetical protein
VPALCAGPLPAKAEKQTAGIQTANKKATVKVAFCRCSGFAGVFDLFLA